MSNTNGATTLTMVKPDAYSQADYVRWQIVGRDVDKDEFDYFLAVARHLDLDPLRRQIYCVKRGQKAVVQTGIDGYRVIASRTGQLAGIDDAEFGPADKDGHPAWARITVWRMVEHQRCPFTATARWLEYRQVTGKGDLMPNWKSMPYLMLAKCAEALALRKAFPEALSGLYTDTEMGRPVPEVEAISLSTPQRQITPPPADQEPPFGPPHGTWGEWCAELAKEAGIFDTKDDYLKFIAEVTGKDPTRGKLAVEDWQALAHHLQHIIAPDTTQASTAAEETPETEAS